MYYVRVEWKDGTESKLSYRPIDKKIVAWGYEVYPINFDNEKDAKRVSCKINSLLAGGLWPDVNCADVCLDNFRIVN